MSIADSLRAQSACKSLFIHAVVAMSVLLTLSTKSAFAIPTQFVGSGSYIVSVEGQLPTAPGEDPGYYESLLGSLSGTFTLNLSNFETFPSDPGVIFFDYILDGSFSGTLSRNYGAAEVSSADVHGEGSGRYREGDLLPFKFLSNNLEDSIVTLLVGADQYVFNTRLYSGLDVGIRENGTIETLETVNTLLPNGSYFFGIPEFGAGGTPEVFIRGQVVPTEVPEPASAALFGLGALALMRRKRS